MSDLASVVAYPVRRGSDPLAPPPELREMQAHAPLSRVRLWDGSDAWLVTDDALQRQVLSSDDYSADARKPGYPHVSSANAARKQQAPTISSMDNPDHGALKRMVARDFAPGRTAEMRPVIQRIVDEQIEQMLASGSPTDLVDAFAIPVPSLVTSHLLGVPYADHERFQACSHQVQDSRITSEQMMDAIGELRELLSRVLRDKAARPEDDVLTHLNDQVLGGNLTEIEAVDLATLMLFAGHDTTAHMITLGTVALLNHPDQLAAVQATDDPKLIANTVEELLRYLTVAHLGRRRVAARDLELGGESIRAGEGVICANDVANRDPGRFPDPDQLDVLRPNARSHLAFGFGVHQCLGQTLARVELQVVYGTLYRRIPTLRLAVPYEDLEFLEDMNVYGLRSLPIAW